MIEVFGYPGCFRWKFISEKGRTLYESKVCYLTDHAAHKATKILCAQFNVSADKIDRAE